VKDIILQICVCPVPGGKEGINNTTCNNFLNYYSGIVGVGVRPKANEKGVN